MTESQDEQGATRLIDVRERPRFSERGPQVQILAESQSTRVLGLALRAGQEMREHQSASQLLVQVIGGNLVFSAAGQAYSLFPGMILQVDAHVPHHLHATTDTRVLLTMTPNPTSIHTGGQT
jgi:quercetin dioxygenase-like cupin family protein